MSTLSVTQRQGLLTFDEETQNLLMYCQLYASLRFDIDIVASQNEPAHSHEILYDPDGNLPRYLRRLGAESSSAMYDAAAARRRYGSG
jgi:hypothetical protein